MGLDQIIPGLLNDDFVKVLNRIKDEKVKLNEKDTE